MPKGFVSLVDSTFFFFFALLLKVQSLLLSYFLHPHMTIPICILVCIVFNQDICHNFGDGFAVPES